jgi:hypothetical protein
VGAGDIAELLGGGEVMAGDLHDPAVGVDMAWEEQDRERRPGQGQQRRSP